LEEFLSFGTYVFDCDGVIWGIPERDSMTSVATINHLLSLDKRVMFVTNNSNKCRRMFLNDLELRGVKFEGRSQEEKLSMMISSSYTTANFLIENGFCKPFVITSETGILEELRLVGITDYFASVTDDGRTPPEFECNLMKGGPPDSAFPEIEDIIAAHPSVDCIVVGWDLGLTARKVATAINYIQWYEDLHGHKADFQQMLIISSSGDAGGVLGKVKFNGSEVKLRAIGNGPMANIIAGSFDPPREWIDCGKPSDALLWLLRSAYGVDVSDTLMIGDTLQTDIMFGNRGGMATLLVMSGVTTQAEFESAARAGNPMRRPTFVLPKVGTFYERGDLS